MYVDLAELIEVPRTIRQLEKSKVEPREGLLKPIAYFEQSLTEKVDQ